MTFDRYLAVLYPFKSIEYRTTKIALITNIAIWIGKRFNKFQALVLILNLQFFYYSYSASFTLNLPYYIYYNEDEHAINRTTSFKEMVTNWTSDSSESTIFVIKYCVATFPSLNFEILLTLYTVLISYVLPLIVIIFCYMRMIINIYFVSNDQNLVELSKNYSSAKSCSSINKKETSEMKKVGFLCYCDFN